MAEQQVDNFGVNAIITPNNRTWTYERTKLRRSIPLVCLYFFHFAVYFLIGWNIEIRQWQQEWRQQQKQQRTSVDNIFLCTKYAHVIPNSLNEACMLHKIVQRHTHIELQCVCGCWCICWWSARERTFSPQLLTLHHHAHFTQHTAICRYVRRTNCTCNNVNLYLGDNSDTNASSKINVSAFLLSGLKAKKKTMVWLMHFRVCLCLCFIHWTICRVQAEVWEADWCVCVNFISVGVEMAWFLMHYLSFGQKQKYVCPGRRKTHTLPSTLIHWIKQFFIKRRIVHAHIHTFRRSVESMERRRGQQQLRGDNNILVGMRCTKNKPNKIIECDMFT